MYKKKPTFLTAHPLIYKTHQLNNLIFIGDNVSKITELKNEQNSKVMKSERSSVTILSGYEGMTMLILVISLNSAMYFFSKVL